MDLELASLIISIVASASAIVISIFALLYTRRQTLIMAEEIEPKKKIRQAREKITRIIHIINALNTFSSERELKKLHNLFDLKDTILNLLHDSEKKSLTVKLNSEKLAIEDIEKILGIEETSKTTTIQSMDNLQQFQNFIEEEVQLPRTYSYERKEKRVEGEVVRHTEMHWERKDYVRTVESLESPPRNGKTIKYFTFYPICWLVFNSTPKVSPDSFDIGRYLLEVRKISLAYNELKAIEDIIRPFDPSLVQELRNVYDSVSDVVLTALKTPHTLHFNINMQKRQIINVLLEVTGFKEFTHKVSKFKIETMNRLNEIQRQLIMNP